MSTGVLAGTLLATALLAVAGLGFMQPTGEQSKLVYDGKLWCVSNYLEQEPQEILNDGRPRQDKLLDGKTNLIVRDQVQADSKEEAEAKAQKNGNGLFEPSDKTTLRAALSKNPPDEKFFTTHFNTGATVAGPCLGGGSSQMVGMWLNDRIRLDCFDIQPVSNSDECGFDTSKLALYSSGGGADPGAKYTQTDEAKNYAVQTLKIDPSMIKRFSKSEVENMIRAEVARQFATLPNKYGSTVADAQQAILSYQMHESSAFQLFDDKLRPSYTFATSSSAAALDIMSLTNDKFNSKNKRVAASYDIKYAIYLGVQENMAAFSSSHVSGTKKDRWHSSIGYVFSPANPTWYWSNSKYNATSQSSWDHYSKETAYVCPTTQAASGGTGATNPSNQSPSTTGICIGGKGVPEGYAKIFAAAGHKFGVNPAWIASIFAAENGIASGRLGRISVGGSSSWPSMTRSWGTSTAGALGPMQFMPGTWPGHAQDGNGDGKKDVQNLYDAIYAGAHYIKNTANVGSKNPTDAEMRRSALSYVAGPGNALKPDSSLKPEAVSYVYKTRAAFGRYNCQ